MFEYLPWSKAVLDNCLVEYRKRKFTVLDIELGADCNFTCIYCDSPKRNRTSKISVLTIERFLQSKQIKWIHICGLGEPTFSTNYSLLIEILKLCEEYGVKCNMFSNVSNLTDELLDYLRKGILYILFKIDTLSNTHAANVYGINASRAQRQIENIKRLNKLVVFQEGCTNLAASLVPTTINAPVIVSLVNNMYNNGIFPMIGDLENSGRGRDHFEALKINENSLKQLEKDINSIVGYDYSVPQCPAVISSIHISSENEVVVDEFSGLSCNWFWLEEPKLKTLAVLSQDTTLEEVSDLLMEYRKSRLPAVKDWLDVHRDSRTTFGGCGGDINSLLNEYMKIQGGIN